MHFNPLAYFKRNKFMVIVMNNYNSLIIIEDGMDRFFLKEYTKTLQSLSKNCSISSSMFLKYSNHKHKHLKLCI